MIENGESRGEKKHECQGKASYKNDTQKDRVVEKKFKESVENGQQCKSCLYRGKRYDERKNFIVAFQENGRHE